MRSVFAAIVLVGLLSGCSDDRANIRPSVPLSAEYVVRGREIVTGLGACGYCHGAASDPAAPLSGGRVHYDLYGAIAAANLTPAKSGLADWEARDVIKAFRSRVDREGSQLSPEMHKGMEWIADRDLLAIVAYLRTLAPVENTVEARSVSFISRNTTGFFEGSVDLRGFIPTVDARNQSAYGRYLVNNLARCTACHNTPATLISAEGLLTGGASVKTSKGEKTAPDITASGVFGIGEWSEDAIVHYLRSGETPDRKRVDPAFCPVNFYTNAAEQDLRAIAVYLKSVGAVK